MNTAHHNTHKHIHKGSLKPLLNGNTAKKKINKNTNKYKMGKMITYTVYRNIQTRDGRATEAGGG